MPPDTIDEPRRRQVFDAFMFFNELDVLEIRLRELAPVVDWFLIVEASLTFSGKPKDLVFEKNRARFRDFEAKILYEPLQPGEAGMTFDASAWHREHAQRDYIHRCLCRHGARADDVVIVSDVDEIPRAAVVRQYHVADGLRKLDMPLFYYFLNLRVRPTGWQGAFMIPFGEIDAPLTAIRATPARWIERAGWHFAYLGGVVAIQAKIVASAHTEFDRPVFLDEAHLTRCMCQRTDLFDRGGETFELVSVEAEFPAWVVEAKDRLKHLLYTPV